MSKVKKLFVIRKYVVATDVMQAIRKERFQKVDDIWLDDDWKKNNDLTQKIISGYKK